MKHIYMYVDRIIIQVMSPGVLCMDADNDSCLWLNTNAETIGQKRHV